MTLIRLPLTPAFVPTAAARSNADKKAGRLDVIRLRDALDAKLPQLVRMTSHKYRIALAMNRLHISNRTLERLKRSVFYKTLYNAIRKK